MNEWNLQESPIRKNINSLKEGQLSVFEEGEAEGGTGDAPYTGIQARTILRDVENMLDVMESHAGDAVRIAVMGETKAGKSTLINVLLGREVAYTDVLEATAIVSEITWSDEEYVRLIGADGSVIRTCSVEEQLAWMEEMVDDEGDFSEYEKISVGVSSELLKSIIIVDTPGLLSITQHHHDVTNKYVADTDYILWVINSRNLGSKAVNDYIDKIKLSGKPIIGIINKVDSAAERTEVEQYIEREYSPVFEEIYYISAKNAWKASEAGEDGWQEETGFADLYDCLEDLAEDKSHSMSRTQYYQLQREREVHVKMRERIKERKDYYDNEISTFSYVNQEIKNTVRKEIDRWCRNELFVREKQELLSADNEEFQRLAGRYSDPAYITELIQDKYNEISAFIYKKWKIVIESLALTSSQVMVGFSYDKTIELEEEAAGDMQDDAGLWEGLKKGAAIGVAFAGYWAWLGPAASAATFVGSLVPWVIPFAVAGAALAGIAKKRNENRAAMENARKKQKYAEDLYREVMEAAARERGDMQKALLACSDHYYEDKCDEYRERTAQFHFDFTEPAFGTFIRELDAYIQKLDRRIKVLGRADIPEPPETDGFRQQP